MKKSMLIVATTVACLSTLCATLVRADDSARPLTREEVVAQTLAARQSGELAVLNAGGSWTAKTAEAPKTRDEVIHEFMLSHQSSDAFELEHSL